MIAITRKNFSSLCLNPNSSLCNSILHFIPSIHFSSTSKINTPKIYDVLLHKHQFSPESVCSLPPSLSPKLGIAERADLILSFMKENSFTTPQLEKIVVYNPRILGLSVENVKSRLEVFQELGLSPEEIAQILSSNQLILQSSVANRMIPALSVLKSLLGSNDEVARLLKRCAWFVAADLEKILMPNVEILKRCGMPMGNVLNSLFIQPRSFLNNPDIMRKSVNKAIQIGVPLTSSRFIYAASVLAFTSEGIWEAKLQTLRDLGFSDNDIFAMFRKQPPIFALTAKKMKDKIELVLATGKYDISSIVASPAALGLSVEKRIEPRFLIMRLLESRNLIPNWPPFWSLLQLRDDQFFERYIRPYYDEIGEERITQRYIPRPKGK